MNYYISIDPGTDQCGLLLADMESGKVIEAGISSLKKISDLVYMWFEDYEILNIIIGDGTNSKYVENQLKLKNSCNIYFVNEEGSTLRARFRYWEIWPPNYLIRWLPKEILFPPDNLDAIVALVLLEDFLKYTFTWPEKLDIKIWP